MSETQSHGSSQIAEAHRRLEMLKENHKQKMFEDDWTEDQIGPEGITTQSFTAMMEDERDRIIADVCEEIQGFFPEPEPEVVQRFRAMVIAVDTMRTWDGDTRFRTYGNPIAVMHQILGDLRNRAMDSVVERLELETPTEEGDADVLYIVDPVSKVRITTARPGYKDEYDEAYIRGEKERLAEQILYDAIPDSVYLG